MEKIEADIVIVGAGIAGLSTAVGLHRLGCKSLVLETSENLRVTGFAFTSWNNAWKALDALGVGDLLRIQRPRQQADYETRCLERKMLVETLANTLPRGSIRFSSKVLSIEESVHHSKLLHLHDGTTIKTKVLIGCDGINSIVGRWLGLKKPQAVGKSSIGGFVRTPTEAKLMQFMGDGVKYGIAPINDNSLYWFLTFIPSGCTDEYVGEKPAKMKEFVLSKIGKGSEKVRELMEKTELHEIICSPLKFRLPWEALWGDITKGNVCVAGDALHPMTPDLGQGACSSLEDGVVLARCLGRAMLAREDGDGEEEGYRRAEKGLKEFAKKRRWRVFMLMATAYGIGFIEQGSWKLLQPLRDFLAPFLNWMTLFMADYDCGKLVI